MKWMYITYKICFSNKYMPLDNNDSSFYSLTFLILFIVLQYKLLHFIHVTYFFFIIYSSFVDLNNKTMGINVTTKSFLGIF